METIDISIFVGKTFSTITGMESESEEVRFHTIDGESYLMFHKQDCSENVYLNDVIGNPQDLIGLPILHAYESWNGKNRDRSWSLIEGGDYSQTWTFYVLSTIKGTVVLRWKGESNGYYSESVEIIKEE